MSISPPRPKGPHLNALRAFESAGRLRSFSAAADELCVTAGAISQHIKSLEAWAGGDLFERHSKGVTLTPLGAELLPQFTTAFDALSSAVQSLRTKSAPNKITIATLPSIAQMWLSRQLGKLRQTAPDVNVSVVAVETPPNLEREPIDISIFFKDGALHGEDIPLLQDRIFPVCAPEIAKHLRAPEDLAQETLLYDSTWEDDWALWSAQLPAPIPVRLGSSYSLFSVAVEEAQNGAGVLMAHEALVEAKLAEGSLVAPFAQSASLPRHLVMRATRTFRAKPICDQVLAVISQEAAPR